LGVFRRESFLFKYINFFRNISPQLLSAILNHNSFSSMNSQFSGEQEQEEQVFLDF